MQGYLQLLNLITSMFPNRIGLKSIQNLEAIINENSSCGQTVLDIVLIVVIIFRLICCPTIK